MKYLLFFLACAPMFANANPPYGFNYSFGGGGYGGGGGFPGHPGAPFGGPGNPYQPHNYPPGSIPGNTPKYDRRYYVPVGHFLEDNRTTAERQRDYQEMLRYSEERVALSMLNWEELPDGTVRRREDPPVVVVRPPSPPLESVYPELAILPALHQLALPVANTIIEIGTRLDRYRDTHDYPRIETPYGPAEQDMSPEALAVRERVEAGDPLYRIGTRRGTIREDGSVHPGSNVGNPPAENGVPNPNAQFWATENPNSPGYIERYGIPQSNVNETNFIEVARMRPNSTFITRPAPGVGANQGGAYEVVIPQAERTIEMQGHSSF